MSNFSLKEVISYGFGQAGKQWRFFLPATALVMAIAAATLLFCAVLNKTFLTNVYSLQLAMQQQDIQAQAATMQGYENMSVEQKQQAAATLTQKRQEIAVLFYNSVMPLVKQQWPMLLVSLLIILFVASALFVGIIRLSLHYHDTGIQSLHDLNALSLLPKFTAATCILFSAMLGWILFVGILWRLFLGGALLTVGNMIFGMCVLIPLVYFGIRVRFVWFALVDNRGVLESIRHSWRITKGHVLRLMVLQLLEGIMLIPKLFRVPVFVFPIDLMLTRTYRKLEE